jgi:hypothetical protein
MQPNGPNFEPETSAALKKTYITIYWQIARFADSHKRTQVGHFFVVLNLFSSPQIVQTCWGFFNWMEAIETQ